MSHTSRRKRDHNAHAQGRCRAEKVKRRPLPMAPMAPMAKVMDPTDMEALATDHAIVRWLERVVGVDVRAHFASELLTADRAALIASMSHGALRVQDGNTVMKVVQGRVVTIMLQDPTQ